MTTTGLITANTITASGLITGNAGITVPAGQTLTSSGTITANVINASGLITGNAGISVPVGQSLTSLGTIAPSSGSGSNGIIWPGNPGGGTGDLAYIKYYQRALDACTFEISTSNDTDDNIFLNPSGGVGIGTAIIASTAIKLHVVGDIYATGNITAGANLTAYQTLSDDRLKTKIANISESLKKINKLNGFYYKVNELGHSYGIISTETEVGLSAQEVQTVLPEIVDIAPFDKTKDNDGNKISKSGKNYLSISYEKLAPIFVEAIKELNEKNKLLINDNIELKEKYNKLSEDITLIKQKLNLQ
jgi:hypothetical protein